MSHLLRAIAKAACCRGAIRPGVLVAVGEEGRGRRTGRFVQSELT
jgi:hypothetical protein